ncbi:MAG: mannose-1-phosphate guanylyltransferase [Salinirussus sp.]
MNRPIVGLVLAGGRGTRLYPASSRNRPKQLLALGGDRSLLARTVDRAGFADERYVLAPAEYADRVREEAPGAAVLVEPDRKDTGPALVYATHRIREQVGDCVVLALPSDHHVRGDFAATGHRAVRVASRTGSLVTVGVEPDRPATGYGYIEPGADHGAYCDVSRFVEKPDATTAQSYCERGWYWNAGIFAWTPGAFLRAAGDSELGDLVGALDAGDPEAGFAAVDPVSVDRAVLEGAPDRAVVPATFEWADLGSWDAVGRVVGDGEDNDAVGPGETVAVDATDCVLAAGDDTRVGAVGVSGLVVATYDDRTVVVPRAQSQRVRELVGRLTEE